MKKIKTLTLILFVCYLLISCNKPRNQMISYELFNIENIDNISLNLDNLFEHEALNKQGYRREVADVIIFNKQLKDTLTQLQFDNDLGKILYKTWYVNLGNKNDKTYINDIFYKKGIIMMSDFTYCAEDKNSYFFPAMNNRQNIIYLCKVYKEENEYVLKIVYHNELDDVLN